MNFLSENSTIDTIDLEKATNYENLVHNVLNLNGYCGQMLQGSIFCLNNL